MPRERLHVKTPPPPTVSHLPYPPPIGERMPATDTTFTNHRLNYPQRYLPCHTLNRTLHNRKKIIKTYYLFRCIKNPIIRILLRILLRPLLLPTSIVQSFPSQSPNLTSHPLAYSPSNRFLLPTSAPRAPRTPQNIPSIIHTLPPNQFPLFNNISSTKSTTTPTCPPCVPLPSNHFATAGTASTSPPSRHPPYHLFND